MSAIAAEDLNHGAPDAWFVRDYWYYAPGWQATLIPLGVGSLLLVGGWQLLRSGRLGASLQPLAAPLAVAVSTPFIVQPLAGDVGGRGDRRRRAPHDAGDAAARRRPLGADQRARRSAARSASPSSSARRPRSSSRSRWSSSRRRGRPTSLRWALISAIPLLPGLAAAGPINLDALSLRGVIERAAAPVDRVRGRRGDAALRGRHDPRARATARSSLWLVGRRGRRPVHRPAAGPPRRPGGRSSSATSIVAATEAERARLAADIHDDALQELTLLVRRLEAAGDAEGAELGRTVAERLRAICGDLRLPILDDLGVGPALDWLVLRIERLAGGEVRLERGDGTRPPPDVELAIFRVAQEALANAVKHGQPPIVVRYRSTDAGASLVGRRRGPGHRRRTPARPPSSGGHFGLLNMQQRAEQIGAILDVRRWPSGGTHVALEWRAR